MENENIGLKRLCGEVQMKKEKGKQINAEQTDQEMTKEVSGIRMEDGDYNDDWEERDEKEEVGGERENGTGGLRIEKINEDLPPVDDVCPICFDSFKIPCRSNCGHWFCATCILQFWMFRASIQPCKCPLCCCGIVNLEPSTSQFITRGEDSVEVLKKVHQYNGLYITGVFGAFHRVRAFPLLVGRIFRVLIDPDGLRCIHYLMRILGLFLALLYERGEFEFIPTGGLGIQRMFNLGGSILTVALFFIGTVYKWVLRRRARRLGAYEHES